MLVLSIVMPVYNEAATIARAVERVLAVDYPCPVELIVVDDGSSDNTPEILRTFAERGVITLCRPFNRGKGAAVKRGVGQATGTHLLILDADLEYDPADIPQLLGPVLDGVSDHVFGARLFGFNTRFPSYRFALGGRLTTAAANALFDACLTDMHACLKLIPVAHFRALSLIEPRFGFDTEMTAALLHSGVRPYEVPITYLGRRVGEGKKITWQDGFTCLRVILAVRLAPSVELPTGPFVSGTVVVPLRTAVAAPALPEPSHRVLHAAAAQTAT
ncbi:glycosyltransferase family 2 protein [Mycobacterium sp. PDNC021]|uniref:glycosyltransferase family 2 protein n=1 Tax=Mycobacterium sp. PDNC021 TaxID=3391399 RepID=UPI003AAC7ADF